MKIAAIVLHYRNVADTLECLASLQAQDYPNYEILLVDNSGSLEDIPGVHLIRNKTNLGFAEGNNIGIRCALERGADAILLLNNDAIADAGLLSAFASASEANPDAGVFGAKIFFHDAPTVIWHAGGTVDMRRLRCHHLEYGKSEGGDSLCEIEYACGCALFATRVAMEKAGLMHSAYFLLWEEIDWCWRIRKAGLRCLYVPEAKAWHKVSRSFEGGSRGPLWQYYHFRNRLLFLMRNAPWSQRMRFYLSRFPRELAEIVYFSFSPWTSKGRKELNRAALKGILSYFTQSIRGASPQILPDSKNRRERDKSIHS